MNPNRLQCWSSSKVLSTFTLLTAMYLASCGGGSGSGGSNIGGGDSGTVGPNGGASDDNTPLAGLTLNGPLKWGRLVDIFGVDANGQPQAIANTLYRDVVVSEAAGVSKTITTTTTVPISLKLKNDSVSGLVVLVIGTPYSAVPGSDFQRAFAEVQTGLGTIAIASPNSIPPFSQLPRDAALLFTFDRAVAANSIGADTIHVFVGAAAGAGQLPPTSFQGRFVWKPQTPNIVAFDPTITPVDDARIVEDLNNGYTFNPQTLPLNSLGLPASVSTLSFNVAVFIPSQYNLAKGISKILLGADGSAINAIQSLVQFESNANGAGAVRAMRSGGASIDANQGFLVDPTPPAILGTQPLTITNVANVPGDPPGTDRMVTFTYTNGTVCNIGAHPDDSIQQSGRFATVASVVADGNDADANYTVIVNYLQATPFDTTSQAIITTPFTTDQALLAPCFVVVQPQPGIPPTTDVDPQSTITVRFSKPMDPSRLDPFENFSLIINPTKTPLTAGPFDMAIGNANPTNDLKSVRFVPFLPFPHTLAGAEIYNFYVVGGASGVVDLVGNPLLVAPLSFKVPIAIRVSAQANQTKGLNLRFDTLFETETSFNPSAGAQVIAGQITIPKPGEVGPRPPSHFSKDFDGSSAFLGSPFNQPVQTPLSPLGSRLMTVYRHFDLGLQLGALTDLDLSVEGLAWAPFGNFPVNDFFKTFRIDCAHSKLMPDEFIDCSSNLPKYPSSGLVTTAFNDNIFDSSGHPEVKLFQGSYTINPNASFTVPSGAVMVPFPAFTATFNWRNTSFATNLNTGAPNTDYGVNPEIYFYVLAGKPTAPPTSPPPNCQVFGQPAATANTADHPYKKGGVPSVGLPLLVDFRTYPATDPNTKGLNGFQVALQITSSSKPNFRVFSTGGFNGAGNPVTVTPDVPPSGVVPFGGFYPPGNTAGVPAGTPTPPDGPETYLGRVSFVLQESRAFSHFYLLGTNPTLSDLNVVLVPAQQPSGTSAKVDFRGADAVTGPPASPAALNDARCFDAYGQVYTTSGQAPNTVPPPFYAPAPTSPCGSISSPIPSNGYTSSISTLTGKKFLQMRFTFTSDIVNNTSPSLSAIGIAYTSP